MNRNPLRTSLRLNLSQRLAMTPSLLQKIELLTLNRLELSELLNQELAENPVLEEVPQQEGEQAAGAQEEAEKASESDSDDDYEDFDYEYFFGEYLSPSTKSRDWEERGEQPSFERFVATPTTLSDHLNWQLNLSEVTPEIQEIGYFIIGNLDGDGFLNLPLEEIAESLNTTLEQVEAALKVIQTFDPIGVGSRNLQECLLIQIRALELAGSLAETLIRDHLPEVQAKKFKELAARIGCSQEEINLAMETVRNLCPKPGQSYSGQDAVYVQPDVHIYKVDDEYEIALNDDGLPKLRLSTSYREMLKKKSVNKETKAFVKERFRAAIELLKSVDQRQETIYRACVAIVKRQKSFLDSGFLQLKPMLIKDVAEELGVHSSTVSRVVANKHAHTPQGIIELRKFFTTGLLSSDGEDLSVIQVKEQIRKIIADENPDKPLSDQKIAFRLNQSGVQITRRTVAKYRDQMKIPGSRERKVGAAI